MSITITRVKGVKIRVHFTFLIVFALVTWALSAQLILLVLPGLAYAHMD